MWICPCHKQQLPIYFLPSLVESRRGRNVICWVGRYLNDVLLSTPTWWTSSVLLCKISSCVGKRKPRPCVTFFNFFSFCYKTLSFSRFVRESFVRENFQKISAHRIPTFYSFLTNKHVMYLDYIPKLGQEVVEFAHKIFTSAMKLHLSWNFIKVWQ